MDCIKQLALLAIFATSVYAIDRNEHEKSIGIFNVVKFPNSVCNADNTNMNGTCYTAEECESRDGTASGSCAEGYGVCCIITVACGGTTAENCTYLQQEASNSPRFDSDTLDTQCSYKICPQTSSVNRIKLELRTFTIAPPGVPTALDGAAVGTDFMNTNIGQCIDDTFSAGNSPIICGTNSGQHMIVDTDGESCVTALFSWGLATQSRSYTIHVIQYESTNEMGGPPGCLQFFTGATGLVQTFNWQTTTTSTHLANQNYDVCVRKMIDRCAICWAPEVTGTDAAMGTFGVNNGGKSADGDALSATGVAECGGRAVAAADPADSNDFIIIPQGVFTANNAAVAAGGALVTNTVADGVADANSQFCGRFLNANAAGDDEDQTICSRSVPFKLGVRLDGIEATGTGAAGANEEAAAGKEQTQEASGTAGDTTPLGTMGFSLGFTQITC